MTAPKYRADIKGRVKETIADFECGVRGELANSNDFIFEVTDTGNYEDWKDYLTLPEMTAAFKRAQTATA